MVVICELTQRSYMVNYFINMFLKIDTYNLEIKCNKIDPEWNPAVQITLCMLDAVISLCHAPVASGELKTF